MVSFFSFGNKLAFRNNKVLVRSSNLTLSNTANVDSAFWNGGERATSVGTNGGPSYYGCYDMMGNNWQWTDLYAYPSPTKGSLGLFWGNSGPGSSLKAVMGSAAYWDHKASQAYSTFGVRIASMTNPDSLPNFVLVGDSGNARDTVRNQWNSMLFGDVSYNYYINKYQLTVSEYVEFLNSVAATDTYNLYKCPLIDGSLNPETSILRTGASGSYSYSVKTNYSNKPVGNLSWFMAARYCNWLHNGKPSGSQNSGTTETGAYTLNGAFSGNAPIKNSEAKYSMPSMNEWYKAAYYKGGGTNAGYWLYPTQSNIRPALVLADQNGNGTTRPTTLSPSVSTGTNVTTSQVQDNIFNMGLSLTYANISSTGVTKITPITQNDPKLPINFSLSNNLGKYNISTTSIRSGNIDLCFVLPSSISLATFNKTKIFHTNSSGITTDITITTGTSAPKYSTRTICGRSANFSDFHLIPENDISSYPIPTNVSGSGSNGKVSLSWNISDPTDVYDYSIKYSNDSGNSWDEFAHTPLTGLSIDVDGLKNNTNYVFRVAAIGISGGVADYATASPTITPVPGCPDTVSGVSATSGPGYATVSWNVPNNNGSTINGYNIQYSNNGGSSWTNSRDIFTAFPDDIASTQSLVVNSLSDGNYTFRVRASNSVCNGSYSSGSSSISVTRTPPSFAPVQFCSNTPGSGNYSIPSGASILQAIVYGGGGGGYYISTCEGSNDGGPGGVVVRGYSVLYGNSISYNIGTSGLAGYDGGPVATAGGSSSLSYSGITMSAGGGGAASFNSAGSYGLGAGGDYNGSGYLLSFSISGISFCIGNMSAYQGSYSYNGGEGNGVGGPGGIILYFT